MRRRYFVFLLLAFAGCTSSAGDVCEDVGDCSQGGDNNFIQTCRAQGKAQQHAAAGVGCGGLLDAYYECATSGFACQGATSQLAACAGELRAFHRCMTAAGAEGSCDAWLSTANACAPVADGGAAACSATVDCPTACAMALCAPPAGAGSGDPCAKACAASH